MIHDDMKAELCPGMLITKAENVFLLEIRYSLTADSSGESIQGPCNGDLGVSSRWMGFYLFIHRSVKEEKDFI